MVDQYKLRINAHVIGEEKDIGDFNEHQEHKRINTVKALEEGKDHNELINSIKEFSQQTGLGSQNRK